MMLCLRLADVFILFTSSDSVGCVLLNGSLWALEEYRDESGVVWTAYLTKLCSVGEGLAKISSYRAQGMKNCSRRHCEHR